MTTTTITTLADTTSENTSMTTMTERSPPKARPGAMAPLRLYLIALLAFAYLVAWWAFGMRPRPSATAPEGSPPGSRPRLATWYEELPASEKPPITLPAGWRLAARPAEGPAVHPTGPVPVRVAPARPGRIRTRSS